MSGLLVLACSPRARGNSDAAAALALAEAGPDGELLTLREHLVRPCTGCGFCDRHPGQCVLDTGDDAARKIFDLLAGARGVLLVMPVYFYGPPAQAKALMDRAQRFWAAGRDTARTPQERPGGLVCVAGRRQGPRLFEASELIGRCFLRAVGFTPRASLGLRGLDGREDLRRDPEAMVRVTALARELTGWIPPGATAP